jgi:hypothetical protein
MVHISSRTNVSGFKMSLLKLFSAFPGSRPDTLLGGDSSSKGSRESSADGLSSSNTAYNSDEEILLDDKSESEA